MESEEGSKFETIDANHELTVRIYSKESKP